MCHPVGDLRRHPVALVDGGEFAGLADRIASDLELLPGDLGVDRFGLGRDAGVLADRHREGSGGEAGEPGEDGGLGGDATAHDAGHQREVGDQTVHGAEDAGPERTTGHVTVVVVRRHMDLGMILGTVRGHRFAPWGVAVA